MFIVWNGFEAGELWAGVGAGHLGALSVAASCLNTAGLLAAPL